MTPLQKYEQMVDKKTERWRTSGGGKRHLVQAGQAKSILLAYHAAVVQMVKKQQTYRQGNYRMLEAEPIEASPWINRDDLLKAMKEMR